MGRPLLFMADHGAIVEVSTPALSSAIAAVPQGVHRDPDLGPEGLES